MMLHLETGYCECQIERDDIVHLAFECRHSRYYTSDYYDHYQFRCPTCSVQFSHMSALLQHVESDHCDEEVTPGSPLGKFLRFLKPRIEYRD